MIKDGLPRYGACSTSLIAVFTASEEHGLDFCLMTSLKRHVVAGRDPGFVTAAVVDGQTPVLVQVPLRLDSDPCGVSAMAVNVVDARHAAGRSSA